MSEKLVEVSARLQDLQDAENIRKQARDALVSAVRDAYEDGVSEVKLAKTTGYTRMSIRRWLGKSPAK